MGFVLLAACSASLNSGPLPLRRVSETALTGGPARFDYVALDRILPALCRPSGNGRADRCRRSSPRRKRATLRVVEQEAAALEDSTQSESCETRQLMDTVAGVDEFVDELGHRPGAVMRRPHSQYGLRSVQVQQFGSRTEHSATKDSRLGL